jgi:hypothetical protein
VRQEGVGSLRTRFGRSSAENVRPLDRGAADIRVLTKMNLAGTICDRRIKRPWEYAMTKRTAPKPDAPVPAESWFVDLISFAHIAARARMDERADREVATEIERDAWAKLVRYCAATAS